MSGTHPGPILVVARGDQYKHWCHTMGLHPRRDAMRVYDMHNVRGFRDLKWTYYGPTPPRFEYHIWRLLVPVQGLQFVEPCNWSAVSGHYIKIREIQKELDYLGRAQASVIAMSKDI